MLNVKQKRKDWESEVGGGGFNSVTMTRSLQRKGGFTVISEVSSGADSHGRPVDGWSRCELLRGSGPWPDSGRPFLEVWLVCLLLHLLVVTRANDISQRERLQRERQGERLCKRGRGCR